LRSTAVRTLLNGDSDISFLQILLFDNRDHQIFSSLTLSSEEYMLRKVIVNVLCTFFVLLVVVGVSVAATMDRASLENGVLQRVLPTME
jgi:hypothetical protein